MLAEIGYSPIVRIHIFRAFAVSPHGIFTVVGFLTGAMFLLRDTRKLGLEDEAIISVLSRAGIGALVGARVFYVLNHFGSYSSPVEWFKIWEGGISLLGGLFGAMVVAWWTTRRAHLDFVRLVDIAAPWLPLGVAIGRIGDLIIADHLGTTTTMPWGFRCPDFPDVGSNVGSPCPAGELVHLTAAYDLLASLCIFGLMLVLHRRIGRRRGQRGLLLGVLYGINRFTLDFFREDVRHLGLTGSQWAAGSAVVVGSVLLRDRPTAGAGEADSDESVSNAAPS